jgi:hypothetical protein
VRDLMSLRRIFQKLNNCLPVEVNQSIIWDIYQELQSICTSGVKMSMNRPVFGPEARLKFTLANDTPVLEMKVWSRGSW